ncbi:hypothetical protein [Cryptosporangium phraense]|uniref:Uncharacterized protein n=1 Tax=Cryptosporangium phraense TaxID=2593070 RepID=A0A545AMA2_9ACTN|nr:hypothetical protein [Cryptosporangium phraense]TQS42436.1 hypothetical protein FL583_24320 [Cryptosporangium phraense]
MTVIPGDGCLSALQSTSGQVECSDALWLTGTQVHQGKLVDYRQSGGEFEYDAIPARLVGETARTRPPVVQYLAGLVGPPLLVGAGVTFLVAGVARSKRRVPEYLAY